MVLVVGAHVTDRIDRIDDPKPRGDETEEHAERLDLERQGKPRHDLEQFDGGPGAREHAIEQRQNGQEQGRGGDQRHALAQVGVLTGDADQYGAGKGNGESEGKRQPFRHGVPPINALAAVPATEVVRLASMPK